MKNSLVRLLATGLYVGRIPVIPGTFGTLWGVLLAWSVSGSPLYIQSFAIIAVSAISIYVSGAYCASNGAHDPSEVVIDEVSGVMVAFFLIPFTALNAILVFILFRFFDILNPYPIRLIDRDVKGGTGVVADDLLAGAYANISAHIIIWAGWQHLKLL